eukprot:TRINITY_DN3360_c0_g1_i3.p2 TRINITY_DN3360_c0_g1~~TRINITY_DN3360_c0_g1_i3.p2  ORF type:complete len:119 (+),score=18.02 TRINITY_DN3360_c0_g1_i3:705-1061(+)
MFQCALLWPRYSLLCLSCTHTALPHVYLLTSVHQIGNYYVADPTLEEEACSDAKLTAAASVTGSIAMQKSGFGALDPMLLVDILQSARKVAASLLPALDNALAREQRLPPSQRGSFLT